MIRKNNKHTMRLRDVAVTVTCLVALLLTSCDSAIYDYEGDCEPHYRVNFIYDYNMKQADAFPHEVNEVTLRLLDAAGKVVWQRTDKGEALANPGYAMDVDCAPGTYSLHVWALGAEGEPFELADADAPDFSELTARMPRKGSVCDERLRDLYHGYKTSVTFPDTEGAHTFTVPLTKDTNYLKVVLQQTSRSQFDAEDLQITVTDDNGFLNPDNAPRLGEPVTYFPWAVTPLVADIEGKGMCHGVFAEFSLSRLMAEHSEDARLNVVYKGERKFSVKLIKFLTMVKGKYNEKYGDQEYLDRQDEYEISFFLEDDMEWLGTEIYINSWRIVLQSTDL